jgi:hypothetical protein
VLKNWPATPINIQILIEKYIPVVFLGQSSNSPYSIYVYSFKRNLWHYEVAKTGFSLWQSHFLWKPKDNNAIESGATL